VNIIKLSDMATAPGHGVMELQEVASLDQNLVQAMARSTWNADVNKQSQLARVGQADHISDPGKLQAMQVDMSEYHIKISLVNALVRKAVSTVETLVKS